MTDSLPPCFQKLLSFGGSHYYISRNPATWMIADVNCRLAGGNLASITSQAELDAVVMAMRETNPTGSAWIGLTDCGQPNGNWFWRNGEPVGDFQPWYPGEPNNQDGEYFVHILAYNTDPQGRWNDEDANHQLYYIMETQEEFHGDDGAEPVPVLLANGSPLFLRGLGHVSTMPYLERRYYWRRIFQTRIDAGASYSQEHSYMVGTELTMGMSFGYSIGYSGTANWGLVSETIEVEFHMDFNFEWSCSMEETKTETYRCGPLDETVIFAVWQLRERFVICDENGDPWSDPNYTLAGPLPYLDQGIPRNNTLQVIRFD
jgi:hypothetical protein